MSAAVHRPQRAALCASSPAVPPCCAAIWQPRASPFESPPAAPATAIQQEFCHVLFHRGHRRRRTQYRSRSGGRSAATCGHRRRPQRDDRNPQRPGRARRTADRADQRRRARPDRRRCRCRHRALRRRATAASEPGRGTGRPGRRRQPARCHHRTSQYIGNDRRIRRRRQAHRCDHLLPHRHRAHFHGRRRPAAGRKEARLPDARGNAGVGGRAGRIDRRGNPRGRRGHHRCRPRSGPGPFRWQATVQERHQAGDQRWPGAHPESPGRGRRARWRSSGCGRQRHIGRQGQCAHRRLQAPDDRCVVHAALRHRWRPVDRAGLRARRHLCRRRRAPGHAGLVAVPDRRQGRFPP